MDMYRNEPKWVDSEELTLEELWAEAEGYREDLKDTALELEGAMEDYGKYGVQEDSVYVDILLECMANLQGLIEEVESAMTRRGG